MPVKLRSSDLESASARLKLKPRKAPYRVRVARGVALGYRRTADSFGTWNVIVADGAGNEQLRKFGDADDREQANGRTILSFDQAMTQARSLARGDDEAEQNQSVLTVEAALGLYKTDLIARHARPYNADWPLFHLGSVLLRKPVAMVTSEELTAWRNELVKKGVKAATVNRILKCLIAGLTLACPERKHIWRAVERLPNATKARGRMFVLPDATIRALVAKAYERSHEFGLFFEVFASTGLRPVQIARLQCGYLILHPVEPRLLVGKSAKGGGRNRSERRFETYPIPISVSLMKKLKHAAAGRAEDDRLLLRSDSSPWNEKNVHGDYRYHFIAIVEELKLDRRLTAYGLRHSAICRQLLGGVPPALVAANCNTSIAEIQAHYAKYISNVGDALTRAALLDLDPPPAPIADNVVALVR